MNTYNKLKDIKIEYLVVIIYFILLIIYLYAKEFEINYLKYKNIKDKETYRLLLYIVFGITFIITLIYCISNYNDLKNEINNKQKQLEQLSLIANIFALITISICLYIIYLDKDLSLEINL